MKYLHGKKAICANFKFYDSHCSFCLLHCKFYYSSIRKRNKMANSAMLMVNFAMRIVKVVINLHYISNLLYSLFHSRINSHLLIQYIIFRSFSFFRVDIPNIIDPCTTYYEIFSLRKETLWLRWISSQFQVN